MIKSETKKNISSKQNTLWLGKCYEKLKDEHSSIHFLSYKEYDKALIKNFKTKLKIIMIIKKTILII